jgi:hypothetical protein
MTFTATSSPNSRQRAARGSAAGKRFDRARHKDAARTAGASCEAVKSATCEFVSGASCDRASCSTFPSPTR